MKGFRKYFPRGFDLEGYKEEDEWWRARLLIYGFNKACSNIAASYLKVGYESMSAIRFCTTSKGDLPHLSYIFRNPEPLGVEFNTVVFSVTGYLIFLDIQWEEEGVKSSRFHLG